MTREKATHYEVSVKYAFHISVYFPFHFKRSYKLRYAYSLLLTRACRFWFEVILSNPSRLCVFHSTK